jgi:hypothetical protein
MLEEEQIETPTSPKSEPEEPLEPEEQIPAQIETYEPVKEEPKVEPAQPEEPPQGIVKIFIKKNNLKVYNPDLIYLSRKQDLMIETSVVYLQVYFDV